MIHRLIWHGPVEDAEYDVEAETVKDRTRCMTTPATRCTADSRRVWNAAATGKTKKFRRRSPIPGV